MKKKYSYPIIKTSKAICIAFCFFLLQNSYAQFVNSSVIKVTPGGILSLHTDYENKPEGQFTNDGELHIFENWKNDGTTKFNTLSAGKTIFEGNEEQIIEGINVSNFKNIAFNNTTTPIPFHLATTINIFGQAEFINGVVNATSYGGKMIFNENTSHVSTSDLSYVDGEVEKIGKDEFEFPVGSGGHYRPSYLAAGTTQQSGFSSEYFYDPSFFLQEPYGTKEEIILAIDNVEYWLIQQKLGNENMVLSLTIDPATTPDGFLTDESDRQIVLIRWDENEKKWVNEGGEVGNTIVNGQNIKFIMAEVSQFGKFTLGKIKKGNGPNQDLIIYNALSPNGDDKNEFFHIKGIDNYPDNEVEIYNRWGIKVYSAKSYNENDNVFKGYSDGRSTINPNEKLPGGTYFYVLRYVKENKNYTQTGYLYISE